MKMRIIPVAFSAVCLLATFALAQSQPPARGPRAAGQPSRRDDLWDEASKFFQENSPHRYQAVRNLPDDKQQGMRDSIIRQYTMVRGLLRQGDTELAALKVQQIKINDNIFAKRQALIAAQDAQPPQDAQIVQFLKDLKDLVRQKVGADLEERGIRIARAENALAEAKDGLLADRDNINALIDDEYQKEVTSLGSTHTGAGARRGGGRSGDIKK